MSESRCGHTSARRTRVEIVGVGVVVGQEVVSVSDTCEFPGDGGKQGPLRGGREAAASISSVCYAV